MDDDGGLEVPLKERDWWARAESLAVGESMLISSVYDRESSMLIRREVGTAVPYDERVWGADLLQEGKEMIVWILDDDGDMSTDRPEGDRDSDGYVVDYGADGTVDRLLDFIDENGDDETDVQDIRYFENGRLRHSIVQLDLDGDNHQYPTHDYQRLVGPHLAFMIDAYGNNQYYHNKYNPETRRWVPFSECPFAFHDLDGDKQTERVVRMSAAPLAFSAEEDPDFANSWSRMMGPFLPMMHEMGVMNIRYTFDIDNGSSVDWPLHYEMGFNMTGALPYDTTRMRYHHPQRRPPRTSYTIPHEHTLALADTFTAQATGFSWREFEDSSIDLGDWRGRRSYDQRWEGIFWTWRRRFMHNTGGPDQHWNMRREYRPTSSDRRLLYYSPVDHRLHLKGATEGWIHVGAIGDTEPLGEVRMFDTTDDGYFDRWEYYEAGASDPYRVVDRPDAPHRDLGDNWEAIGRFYADTLVPEALRRNRRYIQQMTLIDGLDLTIPGNLEKQLDRTITAGERIYILDLIRESLFRQLRAGVNRRTKPALYEPGRHTLITDGARRATHARAWKLQILRSRFEAAYNRGNYEKAIKAAREITELM